MATMTTADFGNDGGPKRGYPVAVIYDAWIEVTDSKLPSDYLGEVFRSSRGKSIQVLGERVEGKRYECLIRYTVRGNTRLDIERKLLNAARKVGATVQDLGVEQVGERKEVRDG
jgi:hypothetical protein